VSDGPYTYRWGFVYRGGKNGPFMEQETAAELNRLHARAAAAEKVVDAARKLKAAEDSSAATVNKEFADGNCVPFLTARIDVRHAENALFAALDEMTSTLPPVDGNG
jgi:hypothetical protein